MQTGGWPGQPGQGREGKPRSNPAEQLLVKHSNSHLPVDSHKLSDLELPAEEGTTPPKQKTLQYHTTHCMLLSGPLWHPSKVFSNFLGIPTSIAPSPVLPDILFQFWAKCTYLATLFLTLTRTSSPRNVCPHNNQALGCRNMQCGITGSRLNRFYPDLASDLRPAAQPPGGHFPTSNWGCGLILAGC